MALVSERYRTLLQHKCRHHCSTALLRVMLDIQPCRRTCESPEMSRVPSTSSFTMTGRTIVSNGSAWLPLNLRILTLIPLISSLVLPPYHLVTLTTSYYPNRSMLGRYLSITFMTLNLHHLTRDLCLLDSLQLGSCTWGLPRFQYPFLWSGTTHHGMSAGYT